MRTSSCTGCQVTFLTRGPGVLRRGRQVNKTRSHTVPEHALDAMEPSVRDQVSLSRSLGARVSNMKRAIRNTSGVAWENEDAGAGRYSTRDCMYWVEYHHSRVVRASALQLCVHATQKSDCQPLKLQKPKKNCTDLSQSYLSFLLSFSLNVC